MIYAGRGVGKTRIAMGAAYAVASGADFLRWRAIRPRRVLYLDGEMPAELMQERAIALMQAAEQHPPDESYFRLLAMDRQPLGASCNLALSEHQAAVERELGDTELLVLDNLSTLVNGGRENDAESWNEMQGWLLQLRRRGVTVLLVHHSGRSDNARGTSKREDVLDTVIHLKHPADYEPEQGARFEVHLTKARGIAGDDALPFEAQLTVRDGRDESACTTLRNRELDEVETPDA
jgi:putative DNA primase/helicase